MVRFNLSTKKATLRFLEKIETFNFCRNLKILILQGSSPNQLQVPSLSKLYEDCLEEELVPSHYLTQKMGKL